MWHCEICEVTIKSGSKRGHLASKKHEKNLRAEQARIRAEQSSRIDHLGFWYCECCDKTLKKTSMKGHLKSKTHLKKMENRPPPPPEPQPHEAKECGICYENKHKRHFHNCKTCKNDWCESCNGKFARCPFCRTSLRVNPPNPPNRNRLGSSLWQLFEPDLGIYWY